MAGFVVAEVRDSFSHVPKYSIMKPHARLLYTTTTGGDRGRGAPRGRGAGARAFEGKKITF